MSADLEGSFAKLIERQPTEKEVRRLCRVKDALNLGENDALWLVLIALESYDNLYSRYPEQLAKQMEAATERQTALLADAAKVETHRALSSLADSVLKTSVSIAKRSNGVASLQVAAWGLLGLTAFGGLCVFIGFVLASGRVPYWVGGTGHGIGWNLWNSIAAFPAGWLVSLLGFALTVASLWQTRDEVFGGRQLALTASSALLLALSLSFVVPLII